MDDIARFDMTFPFEDAPNTACITCCHVLDEKKQIKYVSHDEEDGMWQFLCGCQHRQEEARVVSLLSVFALDQSVGKLANMPCGCYAERELKSKNGDTWKIHQ